MQLPDAAEFLPCELVRADPVETEFLVRIARLNVEIPGFLQQQRLLICKLDAGVAGKRKQIMGLGRNGALGAYEMGLDRLFQHEMAQVETPVVVNGSGTATRPSPNRAGPTRANTRSVVCDPS